MKVDFLTMPGCSHCAFVREVLAKVKADYPDLVVIEHDMTKEPELAGQYMLMSAPGIVIDGELAFTGGVDEAELRERLDQAQA